MAVVNIHKFEAAEEHLLAALKLYFEDGHIAPVHLLASASYEILTTFAKKNGLKEYLLEEKLREKIPDPNKALFDRLMKKSQNFIKHANKEEGISIEHDEKHTTFFMFEAIRNYLFILTSIFPDRKPKGLILQQFAFVYFLVGFADAKEQNALRMLINALLHMVMRQVTPLPRTYSKKCWYHWYKKNVREVETSLLNADGAGLLMRLLFDTAGGETP
ncbi:MAG: hypothetical protein AB9900_05855 [Humidesulfovibrio sp.]